MAAFSKIINLGYDVLSGSVTTRNSVLMLTTHLFEGSVRLELE